MSEAREIAEDSLETAIKDVLVDELESCWVRLKEDSAIADPEEQMAELAEWFTEQIQAAIEEIIEQDPADDEDTFDDDDDDEEEEDEEDGINHDEDAEE
ncbi:MAG: hypothetical protein AAFN12_14100 [Cyanobacteria bacterium J06560_2]